MGHDHVAQLVVADGAVADEVDPAHLDLGVLVDAEPDVDLRRRVALELVRDLGHVEALLDVELLDLLDVLLELGRVEDLLLLDVEDLVDLRQRHFVVAGDVDLVDRRLLLEHEDDHQAGLALGALDLHVLEEAHLPDRAHVVAQHLLCELHAGLGLEVDLDGVVLDLAVAAEEQAHHLHRRHRHRGRRAAASRRRAHRRRRRRPGARRGDDRASAVDRRPARGSHG